MQRIVSSDLKRRVMLVQEQVEDDLLELKRLKAELRFALAAKDAAKIKSLSDLLESNLEAINTNVAKVRAVVG